MNKTSIYLGFIFRYYIYYFLIFYVVFSILNVISTEFNYKIFNEELIDTLIRALAVPLIVILIYAYPIYRRMFNDNKSDVTRIIKDNQLSSIDFNNLKGLLKTIYFDSKIDEGEDFIKIFYFDRINLGGHVIRVINQDNELVLSSRNIVPTQLISKSVSKNFRIIEAIAQKQSEEYEKSL